MNILFVTTHLRFGGITTYVISLAGRLSEMGHRVCIASGGGDMVPYLEKTGREHITLDIDTSSEMNPKLLAAGVKLKHIIRERKIDIVHAQTRVTQVWAYLVCRAIPVSDRPVMVTTCHGFFKPHFIRKTFPCWGSKVIAISESVREHLVNDLHVPKEKITVIFNGVDINKFICPETDRQKADYKKALGLKADQPVVGIIARLSPVKGQRYLLEAFKLILEKSPQSCLLIIGDGPDKGMLADLAKGLNIESSLRFLPSTNDTAPLLAAMDVFAMPSLQEGLGLAIIEAMAAGLPVVASDVGGIYTIVKQNQTGFMVPARNAAALSEAIIQLINQDELRKKIGSQARKFVAENFSINTMARQVEELYNGLIKKS